MRGGSMWLAVVAFLLPSAAQLDTCKPEDNRPMYHNCAPGSYGYQCQGLCACDEWEDCDDGPVGDGHCSCAFGLEDRCRAASRFPTFAPDELGCWSGLQFTGTPPLRVDKSTFRSTRVVFNASLAHVLPTSLREGGLETVLVDPIVRAMLGISEANELCPSFALGLSGGFLFPGSKPYAHAYGGHQFGNWAGQLGDGRAVSLGLTTIGEETYEIALKGAGQTPFSRFGDGRAVLGSVLRELVGAAALNALGIPSTRSLAVFSPVSLEQQSIFRDEYYHQTPEARLPGVLVRVSPSFLRFGSLQLAAKRQGKSGLVEVARYALQTIAAMERRDDDSSAYVSGIDGVDASHREQCFFGQRADPSCAGAADDLDEDGVLECLLERISLRTSGLIAAWDAAGFVHGVMNTDNLSVLGITIDLNVFGFMESFDEGYTANYIDQSNRYAYKDQMAMAYWNVLRLVDAFTGILFDNDREADSHTWMLRDTWLSSERGLRAVNGFHDRYQSCFNARMRLKLGLPSTSGSEEMPEIDHVVQRWTQWLKSSGADYPRAMRALPEVLTCEAGSWESAANDLIVASRARPDTHVELEAWFEQLCGALADVTSTTDQMRRLNPLYTLRTTFLRELTDNAEQGDREGIRFALQQLQQPFLLSAWDWHSQVVGDSERDKHILRGLSGALETVPNAQTSCGGQ